MTNRQRHGPTADTMITIEPQSETAVAGVKAHDDVGEQFGS